MKYIIIIIVFIFCFEIDIYSQTTIHIANFELDNDSWISGGSNAGRTNTTAYSGSWSLYVRSNTSASNWMSPSFSLSNYDKVDFKFFFSTGGYDSNEEFYIEYRSDNLAAWQIIATYKANDIVNKNADFQRGNNPSVFYAKTVTIFKASGYTFPTLETAQFRVRSNSSSINDYIYFDDISIIGTTFNTITDSPGGISTNLDLWLRADKVDGVSTITDNSNVNEWVDTGKGNNASVVVSGQEPIFRNNPTRNFNFNPIIDFENDNNTSSADMTYINTRDELKGTGGFNSNDIFMVLMPDPIISSSMVPLDTFTSTDPLGGTETEDVTGFGYGSYTQRFNGEYFTYSIGTTTGLNNGYGKSDLIGSTNYNQIGIINIKHNLSNTGVELFLNSNQIDNATSDPADFNPINNTRYWLGRSQYWNGSFDGRIAEVITYSSTNNALNRSKIETYLAIKYGITLGVNGTSKNYINSTGDVIWDVSANNGYNYNIAGIGRDDTSALNQKQSKSVNPNSLITIGLGEIAQTNSNNLNSFTTDKDFLIWGSDNKSFTFTGTPQTITLGNSSTTFTPVERKWKIMETQNDIPEVVLSIVTTDLPSKLQSEEYVLIVADNSTFDSTSIIDVVPMKTNGLNTETWYDFDGTLALGTEKYFTIGKATKVENQRQIDFDFLKKEFLLGSKNLELNSTAFTVSAWVKNINNGGSFISKGNGYSFKINGSKYVEIDWNGINQITSNSPIDSNWHYIVLTFNSGNTNLYIDGNLDKTVSSLPNPTTNNSRFTIGALYTDKNNINTFDGSVDEIRIWNVELNLSEIRYIMNQEIQAYGTVVDGKIIPQAITRNDIKTKNWNSLLAYFDMNSFYGTVVEDRSNNLNWARIKYLNKNKLIVKNQTAPLPYETASNGDWDTAATWLNSNVQPLPNSLSIVDGVTPIDWNIVKTSHNINSGDRDIKVLGLISNSGEITIADPTVTSPIENNDGQSLTVTHYLELDGSIDLVGESQLIQEEGSILDQDSGGFVERDQQGSQSSYNYNYWASSVSQITSGTGTNGTGIASTNASYPVSGVLSDATSSDTPQAIDFQPAYSAADGVTSNPTISTYWLWKFNGTDNDYASWVSIDENSLLLPGEGFTMKGTSGAAAITDLQNYLFKGKPNNGTITLPVSLGNDRLIGNPYPSAIDANEFILDNISDGGGRAATNIINGALYYWHHFSGATHVLGQYVGGYATYTLMGGVQAYANDTRINNTGEAGGRVPERYIPVNQGFFVVAQLDPAVANTTATVTGGNVVFKNSQRVFKREGSTGTNTGSLFFKATNKNKAVNASKETENDVADGREKIRLLYSSASGYYRELLVGKDENTTRNFDLGYDAPLIDHNAADMFWLLNDVKFVIQAIPYFDETVELPIGLTVDEEGLITIKIKGLENLNEATEVYLKDAQTQQEVNLLEENFEISLAAGAYLNRFTIVFKTKEIVAEDENWEIKKDLNEFNIYMDNLNSTIKIQNPKLLKIKKITLFNSVGQIIKNWNKIKIDIESKIKVKSKKGIYIIQAKTDIGLFNKKIIIY